ncbi:endonuclease/exonuclease/phosphatase family protein [Maritalea porphyrae]|uniref:endonuclease/exonuclease/phosphatase family protein n=1 Tax=Maritalea porphyrae TaxID=880732 RepID=UPI0022AED409|nr:endonuclease/exonuclease/phosphatase family protein [Maritalea porphyrae]MCZ4270842.1 endonuclease/exonuclease/phosphatase family protein [Maritalea porphyrae]
MNNQGLLSIVRFLFAGGAFFVSLSAIVGFLAFAFWPLDVFNHFQPIIFPLSLALFLISAIFAKHQPFKGLVLSFCAMGFVASSLVVVPEVVGAVQFNANPTKLFGETRRLMTFNIYAKNEDLEGLFQSIEEQDPDILFIQEYWSWHRKGLEPRLSELMPYSVHCQGGKRSFLGVYSKFPLKELSIQDCVDSLSAEQRTSIIAVQVQDEIPFNVVTTHFDWPIPSDRQKKQRRVVADALNKIDGPTLFGGDFNSTPFSYAFKGLVDEAGMKRVVWLMPTWPAPPTYPFDMPPWMQLDHILTRGDVKTNLPHRGANGGSDHYPLIIDFEIGDDPTS